MIACPNTNLQEWKDLVLRIGVKEAFREYMALGDGSIPDASKYAYTAQESDPEFSDFIMDNPEYLLPTEEQQKAELGQSVFFTIANKLSENVQTPYNIVTPEQARKITEAAKNPWSGEKAFFYNGVVYFLTEGGVTLDSALHEFSHPLVEAISVQNKALFDKLYTDLMASEEGAAIKSDIEASYPNLTEKDADFKKEAIVRALAKQAENQLNETTNTKEFKSFIDKLIYGLKQMLRKVFGTSIKIEKLSANTTLQELGKMLTTDQFKIDTDIVSRQDFVAYVKDISNLTSELEGVEEQNILDNINVFYESLRRSIRKIQKDKNLSDAKKLLLGEETDPGILRDIVNTLRFTPEINRSLENYLTDIEAKQRNVTNLIYSLDKFKIMSTKISDHMDELLKLDTTPEVMASVAHYDTLLREWQPIIEGMNKRMMDAGVDPDSDLAKFTNSIQNKLGVIKRKIQKVFTPTIVNALVKSYDLYNQNLEKDYSERIKKAEKEGQAKLAENLQKEWDSFKVTPERIMDLLLGRKGDTNWLSAQFEAYTASPDPVVGGLAMFIKNFNNDIDAAQQRKLNDFRRDVMPLILDAGYEATNFVDFAEKITFKDKYAVYDSNTNQYNIKEYFTFLNPFKNVNIKLSEFNQKLTDAKQAGDQVEYDTIMKEMRQHLRDYFHQEFKDEFYEREDIYDSLDKNPDLEDATYKAMGISKDSATPAQREEAKQFYDKAAKEAYRQKHTVLNEIKQFDLLNYEPAHFEDVNKQKDALWREYAQQASLKNLSGDDKQGLEYLAAAIERKYRKATNEFYEWVPIPSRFEAALNQFEQNLVASGVAVNTPEFNEKREAWIKDNTVVRFTKEFFEERNDILDRIKDVYALLPDNIRVKVDSSEQMGDIQDIFRGFRDQEGQVIGSDISDKGREKIKKLQEEILDMKDNFASFSGLTKDELEEIGIYFDKRKARKKLTPEEELRFNELLDKKSKFGVDKATRAKLQALFRELSILQSKEATDYYVDIVNNWFGKIGEPNLIDNDSAADILQPEMYVELFKKSPEFKEWFLKNHVAKEVFDESSKQYKTVYERLFMWNRVRPNDPDHYEKITLSTGETIQGAPNKTYYKRQVKQEWINEKVVGKNVDNKGNFLPKTIAEGAKYDSPYINEQYEQLKKVDPKAFAALEKLKEFYLNSQEEGIDPNSKLYLQIPRYSTSTVELYTREKEINPVMKWWLNFRKKFVNAKDDFVRGLNFDPTAIAQMDDFNPDSRKVPIEGLFDLTTDETSLNVIDSMFRYLRSGAKQKSRLAAEPYVLAIKEILENPNDAVSASNRYIKKVSKGVARQIPISEKSQKIRTQAVSNLIDREFYGKYITQLEGPEYAIAWKIKSGLAALGGRAMFALNIPSAIKNRNGAILEAFIESTSGRYLNTQSLARGKAKAWQLMASLTSEIYKLENKSLNTQLMEIFDPAQEYFSKIIHNQFGRSLKSDTLDLSFLMSPRKFLQMEATTELMCGMLYHTKVEQTINGATNEIPYIDAWELRNGQIELKPGIDPEYAPGGKKFKEIKNRINQVTENLEGTYSQFDQPEINRTYYGQIVLFMTKFFTSMFMNQFSFKRPNAQLGQLTSGNYASFFRAAARMFKYGPSYYGFMSIDEKAGTRNIIAQWTLFIAFGMLIAAMFDYDDDENGDKLEKAKKRSGPLYSDKFDTAGWLMNHALAISLETQFEYETFRNPLLLFRTLSALPKGGPITATGVDAPLKAITTTILNFMGDENSFYKQDAGPYPWQKAGSSKAWKEVAKIFGFTGKTIDPIEQIEATQAKRLGLYK